MAVKKKVKKKAMKTGGSKVNAALNGVTPAEVAKRFIDNKDNEARINAEKINLMDYSVEVEYGVKNISPMGIRHGMYDDAFPEFKKLGIAYKIDKKNPPSFFVPDGFKGFKKLKAVMPAQCKKRNTKNERLGKPARFKAQRHIKVVNGVEIIGSLITRYE